jgi:UbiD family decarboxylase
VETFREVLEHLEHANQVAHVRRQVHPRHELTAVMRTMQRGQNQALLFADVAGTSLRVATNVFGFRRTVAAAVGVEERQLLKELLRRERATLPVDRVDEGPVQEIVQVGDVHVEGEQIPQIVYSEHDAGAYMTAGVLIARHPETGVHNASWNRVQLVGGDRMRVRMMPPQHLGRYHAAAEERGEPLPCAIVIGAPPGLMLSAASKIPFEADELEVAGGWQGAPLRTVPCRTIPLDVPADAELVVEGEVVPGLREQEGPFGEFTDGYVPVMRNHVFRATAITRRSDAIYHAILAGGTEDLNLVGVPIQVEVLKKVAQYVPEVEDIVTPGYVFGCVISLRKRTDDDARNAMLAALAAYSWIKLVVVVDDDVDPSDPGDVLWAIHTRCTPDSGVTLLRDFPTYTREDVAHVHRGKIGIDATAPLALRELFARRRFPGEEGLDLGDYIA